MQGPQAGKADKTTALAASFKLYCVGEGVLMYSKIIRGCYTN